MAVRSDSTAAATSVIAVEFGGEDVVMFIIGGFSRANVGLKS
jgi:hypothetical protein